MTSASERMPDPRSQGPTIVAPVPQTAREARGWTVYRGGSVIGWVRRAEDCDPCYRRPAGTFWVIPRVGVGDPANYATARAAGLSLRGEEGNGR